MEEIICKECGHSWLEKTRHTSDDREPCPGCASTGSRAMGASFCESAGVRVQAIPTVRDGATGRETTFDENEESILDWLDVPSPLFEKHEVARDFVEQLKGISSVCESDLPVYRGRYLDELPIDYGPLDFGPPPETVATLGRYNHRGKPALYLSDSIEGVIRELNSKPSRQIASQEYLLPLDDLKIADFSASGLPNFINILFCNIERGEYKGNGVDRILHEHGAYIADIVKEDGFHGMRVPGVGGEPGQHYSNIVIFDPEPNWKDWVNTSILPIIIPDL